MLKHILFDCDGVLVDTEIVAAQKMVPILKSFGLNISVTEYLNRFTGKTYSGIFSQLIINEEINIDKMIRDIEESVYENIIPITGMPELVRTLSIEKSIVSNSKLQQIKMAAKNIGISSSITTYFSSEQVKNPKPAPDIYLHALKTINRQKNEVIAVEDSLSGCKAALSAGLLVIGFCGGKHINANHPNKLKALGVQAVAMDTTHLKSILREYL